MQTYLYLFVPQPIIFLAVKIYARANEKDMNADI
jgi:hypothetical protein